MGFTAVLGNHSAELGNVELGLNPSPVEPPPPPPPPVGDYPAAFTLTTANPDGTDETDPIPFYNLQANELLDDSWTLSWRCPDHQPLVNFDNLKAGRRANFYKNGELRFQGEIGSTDPTSAGTSSSQLLFNADGYFETLKNRIIEPSLPRGAFHFPLESPFDMIWAIVSYASDQWAFPKYTRGFEIGRGDTHAFKAQFNWWDKSTLADIIQTIAQLPYVALDYFVDANNNWNIIRRSEGRRPPNADLILQRGVNIETIESPEDTTDTATQVLSVGAGEGKDMLYVMSGVSNDSLYGLRQMFDDSAQSRFGQRDIDFLEFHNENVLNVQKWSQQRLEVAVKVDIIDWGATYVGDILTIQWADVDSGYQQIDAPYRLAQRITRITNAGREESTWFFDTPDRA